MSRTFEPVNVRVGDHLERIVLQSQDARGSAVEMVIDVIAELHERRQRAAESLLMADDRAVTGIGDPRIELPTRHDPGVGHAVRAVLGIPAPQNGKPLELCRHVGTNLGELHARNGRVDRRVFPPNAQRSVGLRIERIVVARAAPRPNQDAVDILL